MKTLTISLLLFLGLLLFSCSHKTESPEIQVFKIDTLTQRLPQEDTTGLAIDSAELEKWLNDKMNSFYLTNDHIYKTVHVPETESLIAVHKRDTNLLEILETRWQKTNNEISRRIEEIVSIEDIHVKSLQTIT